MLGTFVDLESIHLAKPFSLIFNSIHHQELISITNQYFPLLMN